MRIRREGFVARAPGLIALFLEILLGEAVDMVGDIQGRAVSGQPGLVDPMDLSLLQRNARMRIRMGWCTGRHARRLAGGRKVRGA